MSLCQSGLHREPRDPLPRIAMAVAISARGGQLVPYASQAGSEMFHLAKVNTCEPEQNATQTDKAAWLANQHEFPSSFASGPVCNDRVPSRSSRNHETTAST